MIAGIKKYTFLVHHRDYADLLNSLRDAGVVHIVEKRKLDENSEIQDDVNQLKRYRAAARQLTKLVPGLTRSEKVENPEEVLSEMENLIKEIEERKHSIEKLKAEAARSMPWGNFNSDTFRKLEDSDWTISLFSCLKKQFREEWNEKYTVEIINDETSRLYFAVIHRRDEFPELDADTEKIPEKSAAAINEEITRHENIISGITEKIKSMAPVWNRSFDEGCNTVISRIDYKTVEHQADKYVDNNLYILEGWVPDEEKEKFEELLRNSECYSFLTEPGENEKIPIILKNNKFAQLFEPITRLFSLPDYRELDLTPFFAPFFMLFFGFCLGDAGYGLFFVLGGFLVKKRVSQKFRPYVSLVQYLGAAAILFGIISGTFFGINLIDTGYTITGQSVVRMKEYGVPEKIIADLEQLKGESFPTRSGFTDKVVSIIGEDEFNNVKAGILKSAESDFSLLRSFRYLMQDSLSMFYLAIILGALQILFGMVVKIFNISRQKGFKYSFSVIGWVVLLLTLIIFKGGAAIKLIDETRFKLLFNGLLIFSLVLIFIFNTPGINVFLRIGKGMWDTYNVVTGIFGDLLSYIRLFALGISSSILGFVFNDISSQMLSVPYVGWLLFVIILVIGHVLNLFMATLGGFVHPLRLTFVEFYKNAGFNGGGIEYKPFKLKQ